MNHTDEFLQHIAPLAAPLPAPSPVFTRRPRVDGEVIEAMAAASGLYGTTQAANARAWHMTRAIECEREASRIRAELDALRLRDFNLHPGPITMHEPRGLNWGAVAMLVSAAAVSGLCIWGLL